MSKSVEDFQNELDAISSYNGVSYGRAHLLFDEEAKHCIEAAKFRGHMALSDAFKCFFLETVEKINTDIRPNIETPLSEFYPQFIPRLVQSFRMLCAFERVSTQGSPYHGYALLRNEFNGVILTSAALQSIIDNTLVIYSRDAGHDALNCHSCRAGHLEPDVRMYRGL